MEKINKHNMAKLDGLGYIYLLDEPLTDYNNQVLRDYFFLYLYYLT